MDGIIGDRIATLRARLGLTQDQLADRLGVSRNTISAYESGRSAKLETLIKIAQALRVEASALIDVSPPPVPPLAAGAACLERFAEVAPGLTDAECDALITMARTLVAARQ